MNEIIKYFVKSLAISSSSLKKKEIFVDKPWALLDGENEIQKLIFKRDQGLILSKNGKVKEGSWEYYPEAKALLINRIDDKLLLKEQFIDENVLILKKDGTDNKFFALANENTIPDFNIPAYLNSRKCKEYNIEEDRLINGNILQIHNGKQVRYLDYYGHKVEQFSPSYISIDIPDGRYLSKDKRLKYVIKEGKIVMVNRVLIKKLSNGKSFEIENGSSENVYENLGKIVSINGESISDSKLMDEDNIIYVIRDNTIEDMYFIKDYKLNDGSKIKIEQGNNLKIKKGDKIIDAKPLYPLPNGKYKIRGKLKKIKVINNIIN